MIVIQQISVDHELYQAERELRNRILLRPLGMPDGAWEMNDAAAWHFVALEEDRLVGCALLVPDGSDTHRARLIQMAVDPSMQGRGVGKLLVLELIGFGRSVGIDEIHCHSRSYANAFYEKLGFTVYGEAFLEVGIPHNHMRIDIAGTLNPLGESRGE